MHISVLILIGFVIVCLAVNGNLDKFLRDMQPCCRFCFIDAVLRRLQWLDRHNLPCRICDKGIHGFHRIPVTVGLLYQFLALIGNLINLISRSRFQNLFFRAAVFFQNPQIGFEQVVIHGVSVCLSTFVNGNVKIFYHDRIHITGIYLAHLILAII